MTTRPAAFRVLTLSCCFAPFLFLFAIDAKADANCKIEVPLQEIEVVDYQGDCSSGELNGPSAVLFRGKSINRLFKYIGFFRSGLITGLYYRAFERQSDISEELHISWSSTRYYGGNGITSVPLPERRWVELKNPVPAQLTYVTFDQICDAVSISAAQQGVDLHGSRIADLAILKAYLSRPQMLSSLSPAPSRDEMQQARQAVEARALSAANRTRRPVGSPNLDVLIQSALKFHQEPASCMLHAYVLTKNFLHPLLTPRKAAAVPRLIISLGRRYMQYFPNRYALVA